LSPFPAGPVAFSFHLLDIIPIAPFILKIVPSELDQSLFSSAKENIEVLSHRDEGGKNRGKSCMDPGIHGLFFTPNMPSSLQFRGLLSKCELYARLCSPVTGGP
jgi:hypothetical protein